MSRYSIHQEFVKKIKLELQMEFPELRMFDATVGMFLTLQGRPIKIGEKGESDIYGLFKSKYGLIYIQIEAKTNTGRQSKDQIKWEKFIKSMHGIYIVVSNRKSILSQVDKLYRLKEFLNE